MKVAVYPGSFNPWHKGHAGVVKKALQLFDKVIIAKGINPKKDYVEESLGTEFIEFIANNSGVYYMEFTGLLVNFCNDNKFNAIIRGLRNNQDFEYEKIQQYWNEDLGLKIPIFYIISDRQDVHISSSAIKMINKSRDKV